MRNWFAIATVLATCGLAAGQFAEPRWPGAAGAGAETSITVRAVASATQVVRGQTFHVGVDVNVPHGWDFYGPDPGPVVQSAELKIMAEGLKAGEPLWPPDHAKATTVAGKTDINYGYEGRAIIYVPITVPADAALGKHDVKFKLRGQMCGGPNGACVPVDVESATSVVVGETNAANPQWNADKVFAEGLSAAVNAAQLAAGHRKAAVAVSGGTDFTLWGGLGLALLAGVILNIMPCVLPVIPLKVLSIVQHAKESHRRFATLGLSFAGGIMLFFVGVAAFNIVLRLSTQSLFNWGEHFQIEAFRIGMALVMVVLAMNLFGLFTVLVPRGVAAAEGRVSGGGHLSALGMGLLTGVLATPCSFATLGAALAWGQSQTLVVGTLVILFIGLGMASPYAVLIAFPKLVSRIPKPGRWMELLKQSMGFLLLLVAVWLASTMSSEPYPFWVAGYCVVLAFALWMWGSWVRWGDSLRRKAIVRIAAAAIAIGGGVWMLSPPRGMAVEFEPFDQALLDKTIADGNTVVVDFTASWCLTCKAVEEKIYDDRAVADKLKAMHVLAMKGDVTTDKLPAARLQQKIGEAIPFTVVFPPGGKPPTILRGFFSRDELFKALERAAGK